MLADKINKIIYLLFIGCIVALCFSISRCRDNAINDRYSRSYIKSFSDTMLVRLKTGAVQKKAIIVGWSLFVSDLSKENASLVRQLSHANVKARNVSSITTIATNTHLDAPIDIKLPDSIPCPPFNPVVFAVDSPYFAIGGRISRETIQIDRLSFIDSTVIVASKVRHVFRPNEILISVRPSNPHVKVTGLSNITIQDKPAILQKWYIRAIPPFIIGSYIGYRVTR